MSKTNRSLHLLALFSSVSVVGALLPAIQRADATPKMHRYNPALVALYTSSCVKRLSAKTPKAKQACQCSVREMQKQHPQMQAVAIVKKAKTSAAVDPATGVPNLMSKYFAPCM